MPKPTVIVRIEEGYAVLTHVGAGCVLPRELHVFGIFLLSAITQPSITRAHLPIFTPRVFLRSVFYCHYEYQHCPQTQKNFST